MTNYTTTEINSFAILLFFFFYFIFKAKKLLYKIKNRSLLSRCNTIKKLKSLPWDEFERLCMELFIKQGWSVLGNEKKGADGGVDIWMKKTSFTKKNISAIVQCKRYTDALVTIKVIREMYGLMYEYGVDEVYIVTSNRFTKECLTFAKDKKMRLIDGRLLVKLIEKCE